MTADLKHTRALAGQENGLATISTVRADGTVHSSVVNAGLIDDPVSGTPSLGFIARGDARKLTLLRRAGNATITFRRGWDWASVTGRTHLIGPDDPTRPSTPPVCRTCCVRSSKPPPAPTTTGPNTTA